MPGVERVQMVRDARIMFRETPVMVVAVDVDEHRRRRRSGTPVAGDADDDVPADRGRARG